MEHKFYTDNFERLLKEKSDEFRMYPSKRVWHSIYNDLHPDRKWPSIAVSLVLVTVLFLIGYWNNNLAGPAASHQNIAAAPIAGNTASRNNNQNTATANTGLTSANAAQAGTASTNRVINAPGNNTADTRSNSNISAPDYNTTASAVRQTYIAGNKNDLAGNNNSGRSTVHRSRAADGTRQFIVTITKADAADETKLTETVSAAVINPAATASAVIRKSQISSTQTTATAGEEQAEPLDEVTTAAGINQPDNTTASPDTSNNMTTTGKLAEKPAVAKQQAAAGKLSAEDKSWIENYALYNRQTRNRWKGKLSTEIYFTPGAGLRKMTANTDFALAYPSVMGMQASGGPSADHLNYHPGATFEAGAGLSYSIAKNIRIKAGLQANFSNYSIDATEMNHPVLTTLLLTDLNTGYTYLEGRGSSLANLSGSNSKRVHNQTSQISLPVGLAVKVAGNGKLEWYAGAAIQPTYIFGGKANLISFDHKNYVADASMLRSWNLNTAFETYIHYKLQGFTLAAGPELRYQLMSTYSKKYTYSENLYNIGLKIGIVKNF